MGGVIGFEKISDVGTDMLDSMTPQHRPTYDPLLAHSISPLLLLLLILCILNNRVRTGFLPLSDCGKKLGFFHVWNLLSNFGALNQQTEKKKKKGRKEGATNKIWNAVHRVLMADINNSSPGEPVQTSGSGPFSSPRFFLFSFFLLV